MLEAISSNSAVTYEEIAEEINMTRKTVGRAVARLKELGLISRDGSDKTGRWVV